MSDFAMNLNRGKRWARSAMGIALLSSLLACGGGGGGGSNTSTPTTPGTPSGTDATGFSVTLDKSSISFTYAEDDPSVAPAVINATAHGPLPSSLYTLVQADGLGISSYIPTTYTETGATFRISPSTTTAGDQSGTLWFYACSDPRCTKPIGGTPLAVKYTVHVTKGFKVPTQATLQGVSGQPASGSLSVQLPEGINTFTARVTQGSDWLSVGTPNGNELPLNAASKRMGSYAGTIVITANGQSRTVPVTYTEMAPPGGERDLTVRPNSATFSTVEHTQATPQTTTVSLPTWGGDIKDLNFSVNYAGLASDWLTVTLSGNQLILTASAANLPAGTYMGGVMVNHPVAVQSVYVPVTMTVGRGLIQPASVALQVRADTPTSSLSNNVPINLAAGDAVGWAASTTASWLKLTRSMGQTGESLIYSVNTAALSTLPNGGDLSAIISVTPAVSSMSTMNFQVTLHKQLAEARFAGPYVVVANTPQPVRLRGQGFSSLPSVADYVDIDGIKPLSVQLVNDTQIQLQLPAMSAGTYKLSIKNALGLPANTVNLRVVAPTSFRYGAYPTGGNPFWMVHDAWRKSVYFLNGEGERVQRYRFDGNTWIGSFVSSAGVTDLGLAPDGNSLITVSNTGHISLLDADTLATTFEVNGSQPYANTFTFVRFGIPSTNDGRSWLPMGSGWNDLWTFDHFSKTLTKFNAGTSTDFYGGPWMAASRDGERMVVVQSASISPTPPMLYMDTTDLLLKSNPVSLTFSFDLGLSDRGDRLQLDSYEVRDGKFGLVGRIVVPDNGYYGTKSVLSPDGQRLYLLTFPQSARTDASPTLLPRVYVYDTSTIPTSSLNLPVLGQFDLQHYPTCHVVDYSTSRDSCGLNMAVSVDGLTLFIVGKEKFIVAPIPTMPTAAASMRSVQAAGVRSVTSPERKPMPQRWWPGTSN